MNKINGTIISAGICVALSLSAFALPSYARAGLNAEMGVVKEKAAPAGYTADYVVAETPPGMPPDPSKFYNTVMVGEKQINTMKKAAEKAFKDSLGISLPATYSFSYDTIDRTSFGEGVSLTMTWEDPKTNAVDENGEKIYRNEIKHMAFLDLTFKDRVISYDLGNLTTVNGGITERYSALRTQAIQALKDEFGVTMPENYYTSTDLYVDLETNSADIDFDFSESELEAKAGKNYQAGFQDVELSKNTEGKLTMLMSDWYDERNIERGKNPQPLFTETEEEAMVAAAQQFFADKGVVTGPIQTSPFGGTPSYFDMLYSQGRKGLMILFERAPESLSKSASMTVHITSELEVLGYSY
jgi:hypothetical protein